MQGSLQALQRPRALSQGPGRPSRRRLVVRADALDPSRSLERQQSLASREETITALNTVVVPAGIESPKRSQQEKSFTNANFPIDSEGRSLHLGTKRGEVANRVLSVGSMDRALLIANMLEPPRPGAELFQHLSGRGFLTITGRYQGIPVSVVTTLMGMANMDFVVRECAAVVDGQMAVVRLGTCGALRPPARLGDMLIAKDGAVCVRRDPDAWTLADGRPRYPMSAAVAPDAQLTSLLEAACRAEVGPERVVAGLNATADGFYGSQGRTGGVFDDQNETMIAELLAARPELISLEMETFMLLHLAACSGGRVAGAAFCIALAERYSNRFLDAPTMRARELQGGSAALAALVAMPLKDDASTLNGSSPAERPAGGYVWDGDYVDLSGDASGDAGASSSDDEGPAGDGRGSLLEAELHKAQRRAAAARGGSGSGGAP